jgi:hypothetical protein
VNFNKNSEKGILVSSFNKVTAARAGLAALTILTGCASPPIDKAVLVYAGQVFLKECEIDDAR